jgi:hypothetical protein
MNGDALGFVDCQKIRPLPEYFKRGAGACYPGLRRCRRCLGRRFGINAGQSYNGSVPDRERAAAGLAVNENPALAEQPVQQREGQMRQGFPEQPVQPAAVVIGAGG